MDPRSPRVWRPRNAALHAFLRQQCATHEHLAAFFPGRTLAARRKKAAKWAARQRHRGRIRLIGVAQRKDTGRPELVYGRPCRAAQLEHELRVTDFRVWFLDRPFTPRVPVGRTEADGLLIHDGRRCYVEIDNSENMTAKQMTAKWERYGVVDGFILVVCRTEGRMDRLRTGAVAVKDAALFTTWDRLRNGKPWLDWYGNAVAI